MQLCADLRTVLGLCLKIHKLLVEHREGICLQHFKSAPYRRLKFQQRQGALMPRLGNSTRCYRMMRWQGCGYSRLLVPTTERIIARSRTFRHQRSTIDLGPVAHWIWFVFQIAFELQITDANPCWKRSNDLQFDTA